MPKLYKYKNKNGYYIRARPTGAGNITYKIEERGYPIVEKHGLGDEDEIAWSTIQSFKALGIIFTEQSGTIEPGDFDPDPKQLEKTELTQSEAKELYSILNREVELSWEEQSEIRAILGLPSEVDFQAISNEIKSHLNTFVDKCGPDRADWIVEEIDGQDADTYVVENDSQSHGGWQLHVIISSKVDDESIIIDHCIHICDEHGIEYWHAKITKEPTWEIKQVAVQQKSVILPKLIDELQAEGFELGDPTEILAPVVERR